MRPISVLLTNNALGPRGGSETYIRDVALALLKRGHRPVAFSLVLGDIAAELRRATVPVIDDLSRLAQAPDVIHGHHHFETLIAALTFPDTPVVNFCHGWMPWEEMPLHHPAVRRYVAVDEVCVDRLVREEGIDACRVELFLNFVDLDRFRPRAPLPARPARALVLGNAARQEGYVRAIATACQATGVALDVVGLSAGNSSSTPETLLAGYDLVFAKGRTALEALAVGCATVLADAAGAGPLVTPENYDTLRPRNFGIRALTQGHDAAWYSRQIAGYRADATAALTARVRAEAGMDGAIDRLLDIYSAAIAAPPDPAIGPWRQPRIAAGSRYRSSSRYGVAQQLESMARQLSQAQAEHAVQSTELASARGQVQELQRHIAAFKALPTLRLRDAVLKAPVVGRVVQAGAGVSRRCWGTDGRCGGRANAACGVRPAVDLVLLKRSRPPSASRPPRRRRHCPPCGYCPPTPACRRRSQSPSGCCRCCCSTVERYPCHRPARRRCWC